jgi:hypothetical protein
MTVMEVINIEARTFVAMMERFEKFTERVSGICVVQDKSLKPWLDGQDVCLLCGISKRTLQTYRDNGILPFSQIGHKIYYKPEDVKRAMKSITTQGHGYGK